MKMHLRKENRNKAIVQLRKLGWTWGEIADALRANRGWCFYVYRRDENLYNLPVDKSALTNV